MEEKKIQSLFQVLKVHEAGEIKNFHPIIMDNNWQELTDFAAYHNVDSLLYHQVKKNDLEKIIPSDSIQSLQRAQHLNAARNLRLLDELDQILKCLEEIQLPVAVLKGAFLAFNIYSNPALRSMGDLDILLRPADITPAIERLKILGYHATVPPWVRSESHVMLSAPGKSARLEVHWQLIENTTHHLIPMEEIWEKMRPACIGNHQILTLCPEHLILYLCEHAAVKHLFMQGIRSLCDIDRCIRYFLKSLNWELIEKKALEWGLNRAAGLTLALCNRFLQTPIPEDLLDDPNFCKVGPGIVKGAIVQLATGPAKIDEIPAGLAQMQGEEEILSKIKVFINYVFQLKKTPYQIDKGLFYWKSLYFLIRRFGYLISNYGGYILQRFYRRNSRKSASDDQKWEILRWMLK